MIKDEVQFRIAYSTNNTTTSKVYDKFIAKIAVLDPKKGSGVFTLDAVIKRMTSIESRSSNKENPQDGDAQDIDGIEGGTNGMFENEL
jgi:hypothetical protein